MPHDRVPFEEIHDLAPTNTCEVQNNVPLGFDCVEQIEIES